MIAIAVSSQNQRNVPAGHLRRRAASEVVPPRVESSNEKPTPYPVNVANHPVDPLPHMLVVAKLETFECCFFFISHGPRRCKEQSCNEPKPRREPLGEISATNRPVETSVSIACRFPREPRLELERDEARVAGARGRRAGAAGAPASRQAPLSVAASRQEQQ